MKCEKIRLTHVRLFGAPLCLSASYSSSFSTALSVNVLSCFGIFVTFSTELIDLCVPFERLLFLFTNSLSEGIKSSKNTIMKWFYSNSSKWKLIAWWMHRAQWAAHNNVVKTPHISDLFEYCQFERRLVLCMCACVCVRHKFLWKWFVIRWAVAWEWFLPQHNFFVLWAANDLMNDAIVKVGIHCAPSPQWIVCVRPKSH